LKARSTDFIKGCLSTARTQAVAALADFIDLWRNRPARFGYHAPSVTYSAPDYEIARWFCPRRFRVMNLAACGPNKAERSLQRPGSNSDQQLNT
jgi:hypothetical protein